MADGAPESRFYYILRKSSLRTQTTDLTEAQTNTPSDQS